MNDNPSDTLISRLADALRECSEDLEAELKGSFPLQLRNTHASEEARYNRAMRPVRHARTLLAEWEEKRQRWRQA
jgi:hypothetical protein